MAWNKKGFELMYIFFIIFASVLVIALVVAPSALTYRLSQPIKADQAIQAQQLKSRMWQPHDLTDTISPLSYQNSLSGMDRIFTQKEFTYRVALDSKEAIYNKELYGIARPIAPFRYVQYILRLPVIVDNKKTILTIEEYYPPDYVKES